MALFPWFTRLVGRSSNRLDVQRLAAETAREVWPQLGEQVRQMPSAERYGYLRAYVTAPANRLVAEAIAQSRSLLRPRSSSIETRVLEATIDLLMARLSASAPRSAVRRAA